MADPETIVALQQSLEANKLLIKQLEDANASIEKKLQSPKRAMSTGFLELSRELRDMIYRLALVRGKVFPQPRPHDDHRYKDYEKYEKPNWQLLAVNRKVRFEAAEILFKENRFVFPAGTIRADEDYLMLSNLPMPADWSTRWSTGWVPLRWFCNIHLRSMSVSFDCRGLAAPRRIFDIGDPHEYPRDELVTGVRRIRKHHDEACMVVEHELDQIVEAVCNVKNLTSLQLDLSYCCCHLACCRLDRGVARYLRDQMGKPGGLPPIEIIGIPSKKQREKFIEYMVGCRMTTFSTECCLLLKSAPTIQFTAFLKPDYDLPCDDHDACKDDGSKLWLTDCRNTLLENHDMPDGEIDLGAILERNKSRHVPRLPCDCEPFRVAEMEENCPNCDAPW